MKKTSHSLKATKPKSPTHHPKVIAPPDEAPLLDVSIDEPDLAADQFAVAGRQDQASSSGHRIEPVIYDEEGNAEKLIEEGLHGFRRASPNHSHRKE